MERFSESTRTAPVLVFTGRQAALVGAIKAPDAKGSSFLCAFGVLASAAACFGSATLWVIPGCLGVGGATVCACREALENWDSDINLDPICGEK